MAGVRYVVEGGVGRITLARADQANTIDLDMARDLDEVTRRCADDATVRAVLIRAEGERFCAGGDLRAFAGQGDDLPAHLRAVTTHLHAAIVRIAELEAPVVAAVQGSAAGAGFSLAAACDLVVAADDARFVPAYAAIGLSPDGSLTYFLPRLVGLGRALDLLLLGGSLDAREAHALGLVTKVVPSTELAAEADALVRRLSEGPTRSLAAIKRLVRVSWHNALPAQLGDESATLSLLAGTSDAREGIAAFVDRREPRFGGD